MSFSVVIPARFGSTRLPGKPLLDINGKPMIQHVVERARASGARDVLVATDDPRIAQAVQAFGGEACLTAATHPSGTDRIAEVVEQRGFPDHHLIVNLQGDEPLMPPRVIRQVADNLAAQTAAAMATVCARIESAAELFSPHVVKVVRDRHDMAIYFSRASIPWHRDAFAAAADALPARTEYFRHIGLYAYRAGFLRQFTRWEPCRLEQIESLEQLRALWHGHKIHVAPALEVPPAGVDTEHDLEQVRRRLGGRT